jgi:SAM-dependent methyltransferase
MISSDIFGLAFSDYLKGETGVKILVNIDIGEPEELPVQYFFRSFNQMPAYERQVLKICRGLVLDVGAGAGSHALYLQKKGFDVTALDVSPGAVECMKIRGVKKVVEADFMQWEGEKYDTILFLMNGLGMAGRMENLVNVLKKAKGMLAPNGRIYVESTDLLYMYEDEEGSAMINLAGKYYGEIMYQLSYKEHTGSPFEWLFVDFENLCHAAAVAGLECEMFFQGKTDNYIAALYKK